jgi:hypothetical protein
MATEPVVLGGNLEYYREQAEQLHRAFVADESQARLRALDVLGDRIRERFSLNDAEHVLAVEHGFRNWADFHNALDTHRPPADVRPVFRLDTLGRQDVADFEDRAVQLQTDLANGDNDAVRRVRGHLRQYADLPDDQILGNKLSAGDARLVVAREYGYASFPALIEEVQLVRREQVEQCCGLSEAEVARAIGLVRQGDAAGLREMVSNQPDLIAQRVSCRETLLGLVAQPQAFGVRFGRELGISRDVVQVLIDAGSDLDGPLSVAAAHNRVELIQVLLDAGATREARDKTYGITPLQAAIYHGAAAAADVLAADGISPDALYVAAAAGRVELLPRWFEGDRLSARAFDERPNLADVGWTPRLPPTDDPAEVLGEAFTLACYNGRIEAAQWLLEHGADVNAHPYLGMTGLHFAALAGHRAMVEWLIGNGADTTLRDAEHHTNPASWARFAVRNNADGPAILAFLNAVTPAS